MKQVAAIAIGIVLCGCAPPPTPANQAANQPPIQLDPWSQEECARIRHDITLQQREAALSGVMAGPMVEASMRLNAYNVITGLQTRAAVIGCS